MKLASMRIAALALILVVVAGWGDRPRRAEPAEHRALAPQHVRNVEPLRQPERYILSEVEPELAARELDPPPLVNLIFNQVSPDLPPVWDLLAESDLNARPQEGLWENEEQASPATLEGLGVLESSFSPGEGWGGPALSPSILSFSFLPETGSRPVVFILGPNPPGFSFAGGGVVPEPSSAWLLCAGLILVMVRFWRRRSRPSAD